MSTRERILLPPDRRAPGPLSPWVPWIGVLGLAVLGLVTLPATLERRRLDGVHARLQDELRRQESHLERLERLEREAGHSTYVRERALRTLLNPAARER